jgi:ectoine hydroxylase-related dioxygenase (phytanoyl-CoA dioxygenase family)
MSSFRVTKKQIAEFNDTGYLLVRRMFDAEEMDLLITIAKADRDMDKASARKDAQGGVSRLRLRNELYDDIYSAFVRCHRIVDTMEALLGDEVYHFHHKMMLKEPLVGGAWEWHQDYGYWYKNNAALFPDMASCMIAVDRATKENGCLQVIKGSHKMGRVEHGVTGEQTGADMERVEAALKRMELVYCELEPGDALFFHSNLLHRSDQNRSPNSRWSLICCYNTKHNNLFKPVPKGGHPDYSYLERWPDSKIKEVGRRQLAEMKQQPQAATANA